MPRPIRISIPQRAIAVMQWLTELSAQDFDSLLSKISEDDPAGSRTELVDRVRAAVPDAPAPRAAELVSELFSLLILHFSHGWELDQIAEKAAASQSLSLNHEQQIVLKRRLLDTVSNPLITRLARAYDVYGEHQNVLHTSRILNDLRPIFEEDSNGSLIGVIITHTLKLDYHSSRGREELYVALDDNDLEALGEDIIRARKEGQGIEEFIKSVGLTDLTESIE